MILVMMPSVELETVGWFACAAFCVVAAKNLLEMILAWRKITTPEQDRVAVTAATAAVLAQIYREKFDEINRRLERLENGGRGHV